MQLKNKQNQTKENSKTNPQTQIKNQSLVYLKKSYLKKLYIS